MTARNKSPYGPSGAIGSPERREYQRRYALAWAAAHPEDKQRNLRKFIYGLTHEQYLDLLAKQGGKCAICHRTKEETGQSRDFSVDHEHDASDETYQYEGRRPQSRRIKGRIRGILCNWCNTNLGWFEKYEAAIQAYLHEENN